ncbi:MAG: glycosyltransferase [Candidatus Azobacteroides sp.]|nr:glycosyltransferase [Candidatus Azobacteroides sp.]
MNLYLFSDNDGASIYGIGTYLKELTEAIENESIQIHLVHLHSGRPEFEIIKTNQVEHWYIPEVRNDNTLSGSLQKVDDYLRNVSYLLWLHIHDTKDLVFHFNFNQCQLLAKELKAKFSCKTVATVHYLKWTQEFQGNLHKLHALKLKHENQRSALEKMVIKTDEYEALLYKEVDYVIALSQNMKNLLCSEYQIDSKKINVISNGLNDVTSIPKNGNDALRRKWRLSEKEPLLLFAGRLDPVKGLLFLIRAFRKVLEINPNCRLMIAGSGQHDIYFREAKDICTKITFTGLLKKQELYELYRIADMGVMPSLYEPFGYVAVEMMMHGLPIVAAATSDWMKWWTTVAG